MMNTDQALEKGNQLLETWARATAMPEPGRLDVVVDAADLVSAVAALDEMGWGYLAALTGLDFSEKGAFELLYHFCAGAAVLTLRVGIPREDPSVPSICGVIPSASVFERELSEMFGVTVVGTPDDSRLFIPDDWPEGVYPMRKDVAA
jgi:Ni,Fe-hydrogenase III component G